MPAKKVEIAVEAVKPERLRKGGLRELVHAELVKQRPAEVSAHTISKATGKSAGAIQNALEKLVAEGKATRSSDAPKRYRVKASR